MLEDVCFNERKCKKQKFVLLKVKESDCSEVHLFV